MDILLALCLGVALSAACGFRVFIPPFALSLAANYGNLDLASQLDWLESPVSVIALGIATIVEILAYYIPVVDNVLDTIEIPTAIAFGTILTGANLGEVDPLLQWTLAVIAGGGTAGIIESATSITRLASTGVTGGMGNFLLATMEALSAAVLSILALTVPFLAIALVIGLVIFAIGKIAQFLPRLIAHKKGKARSDFDS